MRNKIDFNLNTADLQPLPHSDILEKQVISNLLEYPELLNEAVRYLGVRGMFYTVENESIWNLINRFEKEGHRRDTNAIKAHYEAIHDKDMKNYVFMLSMYCDYPAYFVKHCLKLNEYWIRRTICRFGHFMNQNALSKEKDPLDLLTTVNDSLGKIYLHIAKMKEKTLTDAANELSKDIVDIANSPDGLLGLKSSLPAINHVIKGYRKGNLIVVAASTGEGKTTLALQEAENLVMQGIPVGYISLEMKTAELMLMMACRMTSITTDRVLSNNLSNHEMEELGRVIDRIKKLPFYVAETPALRISEIRALATMWKSQFGIRLLIVDHIHLANSDDPGHNPEQRYTDIANQLKSLAKELDIPVIALSQLSRKEKGDKRPHMITDIKYASGIEQAADVIMMIYRPEIHGIMEDGDGNSTKGFTKILVTKLRLLPKHDIKAYFTGLGFKPWEGQFPGFKPVREITDYSQPADGPF